MDILKVVGKETKNFLISITSTARDPYNQARVMYQNIVSKGMTEQRRTYKEPGQKVLNTYTTAKNQGKDKAGIIQAMEAKIIELGPVNVSKHCSDPNILNVFDINIGTLSNPKDFLTKIKTKANKVLVENGCYHVEIPQ